MASTNVFVGAISTESLRKSRIERLNFFWPLSALCTPFLLRHLPQQYPLSAFGLVAANSALTLLLAVVLCWRFSTFTLHSGADSHPSKRQTGILLLLCVLSASACGAESALFSWAPTLGSRLQSNAHGVELAVGAFWSGLLSGRLGASFLFKRTDSRLFTVFASLLCGFSIASMAVTRGTAPMVIGLFVAGGSIASIYPSLISDALNLRGSQWIFVSAGIGGAAFPWLMGRASEKGGSLRWGEAIPAVACLALGCLYGYARKQLDDPLTSRAD